MNIPRTVWIPSVTLAALLMMGGTVWWLRARALHSIPRLETRVDEATLKAPTSTDTRTAEIIVGGEAAVSRATSFTPEEPALPGINIQYNDIAVSNGTATESTTTRSPSAAPEASEPDADEDGLTDNQERQLGSDPAKKDTDGDTLADGEEVKKYRTDPLRVDSDGDKYTDAEEIKNGYNPLGTGKCLTSDCTF